MLPAFPAGAMLLSRLGFLLEPEPLAQASAKIRASAEARTPEFPPPEIKLLLMNELLPLLVRDDDECTSILDNLEDPFDCGIKDDEEETRFCGHEPIEIDFLLDDFERDVVVDFLLKSDSSYRLKESSFIEEFNPLPSVSGN